MMTNKEISKILRLHAQLMELHGENSFKYRSYQNAAVKIDKIDRPLAEMKENEMALIDGLGAAICSKINQLIIKGSFDE